MGTVTENCSICRRIGIAIFFPWFPWERRAYDDLNLVSGCNFVSLSASTSPRTLLSLDWSDITSFVLSCKKACVTSNCFSNCAFPSPRVSLYRTNLSKMSFSAWWIMVINLARVIPWMTVTTISSTFSILSSACALHCSLPTLKHAHAAGS